MLSVYNTAANNLVLSFDKIMLTGDNIVLSDDSIMLSSDNGNLVLSNNMLSAIFLFLEDFAHSKKDENLHVNPKIITS
jgi:hypothetical protein